MSELYIQNTNKLVRENRVWSGKSQGKVREFCFTQIVDTLTNVPMPKVKATIMSEFKLCLKKCCSLTTQANLIKLDRKIKHNEKV